jgi:hypothetical protein
MVDVKKNSHLNPHKYTPYSAKMDQDPTYSTCMLEKRRHDLADAPVPQEACLKKYGGLFRDMDKCYAKYATGFDSGTWHHCEKNARAQYINKIITK